MLKCTNAQLLDTIIELRLITFVMSVSDGVLIVWAIPAVVVVMVTIVAAFVVACCIVCQKWKRYTQYYTQI